MNDGFHSNGRDAVGARSKAHLRALGRWYEDATVVIDNFDACVSIIRCMLAGSPEANLRIAESLSALLLDSELWLLTHPCPDKWNGEYMLDVVGVFVEIGQDLVRAGGDPTGAPGDLVLETEVASDLLGNIKELAHQVTAAIRD